MQKWTSGEKLTRFKLLFSRHKLPFHSSLKRHAQYFVNSIEASVSIGFPFPPSRVTRRKISRGAVNVQTGISQLLSRRNNSQLTAGDRGLLSRIYVRRWRRRAAFGFILDRARRFMRPIRLSLSIDLRAPSSSLAVILGKTLLLNFPPLCYGYRAPVLTTRKLCRSNFCKLYLYLYYTLLCSSRIYNFIMSFFPCHNST